MYVQSGADLPSAVDDHPHRLFIARNWTSLSRLFGEFVGKSAGVIGLLAPDLDPSAGFMFFDFLSKLSLAAV